MRISSSSNTLGLCVTLLSQGTIFLIDKDSSTNMIDTKSGKRCLAAYSPDTKFKYGLSGKGKDSSWDRAKTTSNIALHSADKDILEGRGLVSGPPAGCHPAIR
jgi:hypothetical protein